MAATPGYLVMTVKAVDKDDNENGRVSYHFKVDGEYVQDTSEFTIDANNGELRIKQTLDRELKSKYPVRIFLLYEKQISSMSYEVEIEHIN